MKKYSLSALVAAGLLAGAAGSASAADLGGNCCADLEERIAELEATTARKGNRKVSLTISGWVAQQVMWWDDGFEDNVYVTDTGSVSIGTHVKFSGQAQISPGWSAGYVLNLEVMDNDSLGVSQDNSDGGNVFASVQSGGAISVESSYWFVKSDQLGRVSVGKQSSAADNQAILVDGSGSLVPANYVLYDVRAFGLRDEFGNPVGVTGLQWLDLADCAPVGGAVAGDCDGYPLDSVRYDSPTFAGFSVSASWGEDDMWAISARYAGEHSGFKFAIATAYNESTDETGPFSVGPVFNVGHDASAWQIGAYLQHIPTGLFIYGAYANENQDAGFAATDPEGDMFYIKAGIRTKIHPLGATVFYGEYGRDDDKVSNTAAAAGVTGSELERWGIGVVQEIDAAAMSLWLAYRHYEGDVTCSDAAVTNIGGDCAGNNFAVGNNSLEDFDLVKAGALINF
jgi:hypothetical protein